MSGTCHLLKWQVVDLFMVDRRSAFTVNTVKSVLRTATNISMFGHYNPTTKFREEKLYALTCEFGTL